jgi:hydroxypyruvate isomerase
MANSNSIKRRDFLFGAAAAPLAMASFTGLLQGQAAQTPPAAARAVRLKQSVMSSVWGNSTPMFEDKCKVLARIGFKGMDLPTAQQVPILRNYGLSPTMMTGTGTSMQNGFIRKENHDAIEAACHTGIDGCASADCPILIGFAGERRGMSYEEAADNTVAIFNRLKGYAEQKKVTLTIEITNSKVVADQRTDQTFNHVAWGLDVCKKVNSPYVKILYDIYHVQIADGDVTRTLKDNIQWICHFHVAGVPGRNEIDETQELNYRFIAQSIVDTGYTGYIAHEFRPSMGADPIKSLEKCFAILNV